MMNLIFVLFIIIFCIVIIMSYLKSVKRNNKKREMEIQELNHEMWDEYDQTHFS